MDRFVANQQGANAMIELSLDYFREHFSSDLFEATLERVRAGLRNLQKREGPGNDFLGWLDLPETSHNILPLIEEIAGEVKSKNATLVCVGIGGSYLGARAVIEALGPQNNSILYAGHHLCPDDLTQVISKINETNEVYLNVISKSGTTTEPAIAFRILKRLMQQKYGSDAAKRIIATTDARKGALRLMAEEKGYRSFIIPDDVGGRFSVLTPVGLFPIACAGIDVKGLLNGAAKIRSKCLSESLEENIALKYATARHLAYNSGKMIEILATFHSGLNMFTEWWKQLFGESEGKRGKALFPASVTFTTDLHSLGQWIQEGVRNILETFLFVRNSGSQLVIPEEESDSDNLNYLAGKSMDYVNRKAFQGTREAHSSGGVPCMTIEIPVLTPETMGELIYFFEVAVALSAYALGVNPFNQPGVETYKKNMFRLLGKPGFRGN